MDAEDQTRTARETQDMRFSSMHYQPSVRGRKLFSARTVLAGLVKRSTLLAVGLLIPFALIQTADARNGFTYVLPCSNCQTTDQFIAAAQAEADNLSTSGIYEVVSSSQPSSAYIRVSGHWVTRAGGETFWVITASVPVDSSNNSLAANSEGQNQSYFAALDQVIFGANRSNPTAVTISPDYASSFINSLDEEVLPGIGNALISMGVNPASIEVGTVITVKFSDGTTAQYVKVSSTSSYQWQWNGIAHDSNGHLIDRNGHVLPNPNTAGDGGGDARVPGFGRGAGIDWDLIDRGTCTTWTTVTWGDETSIYYSYNPC